MCIEGHIHILPNYHSKGLGQQALVAGCEWLKKNTAAKRVITYVPSNCFHVLKFMKNVGLTACGLIPEAVRYKTELVDLFIFQRGL